MSLAEQPTQQFAHSTVFGLGITFSVLAILAVLARFYCRLSFKSGLGQDDWMIIPALITALGSVATSFAALCVADLGKQYPPEWPPPEQTPPLLVHLGKLTCSGEILFVAPLTFPKLSALYLYRRIFSTERFTKRFYAVFNLVTSWGIIFTAISIADCVPVSDYWLKIGTTQVYHCVSYDFNKALSYTNIVMDVAVLSLPIPMVLRLHMSTSNNIVVSTVFLLGAIIVGVGVAQTVAFYDFEKVVLTDGDLTYDDAGLFYWTIPQSTLSVVCACLPVLAPFSTQRKVVSTVRRVRNAFSMKSLLSDNSPKNSGHTQSLDPRSTYQQTTISGGTRVDPHKNGETLFQRHTDDERRLRSAKEEEDGGLPHPNDAIVVVRGFSSRSEPQWLQV